MHCAMKQYSFEAVWKGVWKTQNVKTAANSRNSFIFVNLVTCFSLVVVSDTSTCINTLFGCFHKNGNIRCRIDNYLLVYYVSVIALLTGLTIETTPSFHVLCMHLMHDCVYCLQWFYTASKHRIAPLNC